MTENNKNHAPVAASLNLDDERAKFAAQIIAEAERLGWGMRDDSPFADSVRDAIDNVIHRTPPAEVSADGLPAIERDEAMDRTYIPLPGGWEIQTKGKGSTFRIAHAPSSTRWMVLADELHEPLEAMARDMRNFVAPYAEQIKKLERNQLPNLADGEDEVSFPGDGKVACTTEARYWELRAAEERVAELERELVERKQAQSIGDDAEFLWLLGDWMAGLDYFQSDEHKEVKMAWARLIAYIDARPAGTAAAWQPIESAPTDMTRRLYRVGGFCVQGFVDATGELMVQSEVSPHWRKMRGKPTHWMLLPAAPSLSTGTEESK